ncbi:MAG TPA: glutamate decarboxylase [Solirubrobacteraceae bacterium]|jgi:glutamate decarboxylase|nr:glutamate decarboxylase [Solirubrobacteraceae bacterium]
MHKLDLDSEETLSPTYAARSFSHDIPKYRLPAQGMSADAAYQLVHDELNLDGNPALNLASFVTSWMEPQADLLAAETLAKNLIDEDEYPQTEIVHRRVVSMIGRLFHAPAGAESTGTATIGSSEAIMLAMLAHKRSWQLRREAEGKPAERPNMVMGADVHTCWEKFTRYFEVEPRLVPMEEGRYVIGAAEVEPLLDEHTIAVAGVLGTTFTGQMDDLASIDELLTRVESEHGWRIPIHVDAASGGFLTPFSEPALEWDFRLPRVRSINVSNHKFGLVYPGMGTVVFREASDLPEDLVFHINYLGGDMPNYSLNFSRPSNSVLLQYFAFLRLGREGYSQIVSSVLANATALAHKLTAIDGLQLFNDPARFPIVVVRAEDSERIDLTLVSELLRERGWIVPAYTLPPNAEHINVLRMVVKENFSRDMVDMLAHDMRGAIHIAERGRSARSHRPRRRLHC